MHTCPPNDYDPSLVRAAYNHDMASQSTQRLMLGRLDSDLVDDLDDRVSDIDSAFTSSSSDIQTDREDAFDADEASVASGSLNLDSDSLSETDSPSPPQTPWSQMSPPRGQPRPPTKKTPFKKWNPSQLQARLDDLLPQMHAANQELEVEKQKGTVGKRNIEQLDDDKEAHIEMNLGLGVLEEQAAADTVVGFKAATDTKKDSDDSDESDSIKESGLTCTPASRSNHTTSGY